MNPEISIITVVKDDSPGLQATLSNLFTQTFGNWECLIISATSEDDSQKTADLIAKEDKRVIHIHEETTGIYQAMNQGAQIAKAPYLVFMNAGDIFAFEGALASLHREITRIKFPVVVGGYEVSGKKFSLKTQEFSARDFSKNRRWGCHQSMIFSRSVLLERGGFSTKYRIASDFDLVLRMIKDTKGLRVRELISVIDPNGISNTDIRTVLKEKQEIRTHIFGNVSLERFEGIIWTFLVISKIRVRNLLSKFE